LNRINENDKNGPSLNSIIQINPDAIQIAEELDKEMKSGWSGLRGQTKNPYVLSRNPCGSSSGSAVGCLSVCQRYNFKNQY